VRRRHPRSTADRRRGYFGDAFTDCLEVYGANVTQLKAPVGDRPGPKELEDALEAAKGTPYKLVVFTHVDTSTGVLADAKGIAATVRRLSPDSRPPRRL